MVRRSSSSTHGFTLVELLVSIVIVSIAASTILGVLSMTTAGSADPMIRHQAAAIAEAYLEEILLKPLTDPDGVDGEAARADFDDLDDYTNRLYDSAEGEAAIRRDIEQFLARADAYTTTERIHKDESPASAALARNTVGATAPSAIRARLQTPSAAQRVIATPVIVIASPLRRASL